ncbi:transposase [Lacticaseibacillus casei]|nr:transposase [Lacticaseibacillus casei]MBI6598032.1 IS66 family transposase [Lacticaseibacillus casei]MBO1481738.1 IS66 family transposase [Lacticaseibacillus casei]MBO2417018.1 IS66 family transposase [Lacticaseibacillus casei]MCK2081407.1 IS66 family transposase [Lacticaseibacillus casei]NIG82269.1 transposase [Lacticaseibacillus casei]
MVELNQAVWSKLRDFTQTMIEKYRKKVSANRQEQDWLALGLELSRQQITNWHILACDFALRDLYDVMHEALLKQDVIHADETPYNVLDSEKSKTYFWVFTSSKASPEKVVLYEHANSRQFAVPERFLRGYTGYLQTDGYAAYAKLPDVTRVACLAQIRRKFFEAMGKQGIAKSAAKESFKFCQDMFALDNMK